MIMLLKVILHKQVMITKINTIYQVVSVQMVHQDSLKMQDGVIFTLSVQPGDYRRKLSLKDLTGSMN
ncbi:hypothetical protein FQZ97_680840 [compost metagenome]